MTPAKPRILLIYTGGTIGMIENPVTGSLQPFDFSHLIDNVPKIKMLDYVFDNIQFAPPIDSSDMNPEHPCHRLGIYHQSHRGQLRCL